MAMDNADIFDGLDAISSCCGLPPPQMAAEYTKSLVTTGALIDQSVVKLSG